MYSINYTSRSPFKVQLPHPSTDSYVYEYVLVGCKAQKFEGLYNLKLHRNERYQIEPSRLQ